MTPRRKRKADQLVGQDEAVLNGPSAQVNCVHHQIFTFKFHMLFISQLPTNDGQQLASAAPVTNNGTVQQAENDGTDAVAAAAAAIDGTGGQVQFLSFR